MSEDKIINRIKKMLALANDLAASEGERDNALRMAYATMAKHNIEMAQVDAHGREAQEERIRFRNVCWSWQWARHVHSIIGDLFFCKYSYCEKINGTQIAHYFTGKESNAMTAAVMADYVTNSILKEARKHGKQNTSPITREFAVGAMHKLHARVAEIKRERMQQGASDGTALVLASLYQTEADANQKWLEENNLVPRLVKSRESQVKNWDAYMKGQEFGAKINLDKQLAGDAPKKQIG